MASPRRQSLSLLGSVSSASAQGNYPNRPIRVVVPYPAGGIVDIVARAVTEQVGRDWKQTIVVRKQGPAATATSAPRRSHAAIPTATPGWSPDPRCWSIPRCTRTPAGTRCKVSNASDWRSGIKASPWSIRRCRPRRSRNSSQLARSKPGHFNFGNPGTGSSIDLTAQKLFQVADIKLTNIGYKGQPPALIDLMTNLMHFEIVSLALALPHIKEGNMKPLAVFTEKRIADLPDVPTIAEAGYPDASYVSWYGIYVPSATPDAIVEKINEAINKALQNPDVQRQLSIADIPGKPMSLSELAALMKADHEKLTTVVKASGMTAQ